jgi:hypothetical protein
VIPHHRRSIHVETSSNLSTNGDNSSGTSSLEPQHRSLSYSFSANLFNTYNLLSTSTRNELLHEEDSEDDDDDDSHDDDEEPKSSSQPIFTSRSYSPSIFYHQKHHQHKTTKKLLSQETATTTTSVNDTNNSTVLVDYIPRISPTLPIVSTSSRILSGTKCLNTSDQPINTGEEKNDLLYQHSRTSPMLELIDDDMVSPTTRIRQQIESRNDTSLSKPNWTDDDEQINVSEERTPTSQSLLFRHQNSSTSTTAVTPVPTLPQLIKKSSLPSTTQQFHHHHKSLNNDQQKSKSSPRPLIPLSKYRRIPSNVHSTSQQQQQQQQTFLNSSNEINHNIDSFNEHLMLNKRIEILKTPGKQQSPAPSPTSSINTNFPSPPAPSKRQDLKSIPTTPSASSILPMDSTKVTIGKLNNIKYSHDYSFSFRNNRSKNCLCTSSTKCYYRTSGYFSRCWQTSCFTSYNCIQRTGYDFLLFYFLDYLSLSFSVGYKQSSRDAVIEERYKVNSI